MGLDPLSPIAPARVRILLLPIGRIKHTRFTGFIERLQSENVVRLGDISPDGRPNRNMFSPLAFPAGMIIYDLTTSLPPPSHLSLSPFESFREPLAVVAIADGIELDNPLHYDEHGTHVNGHGSKASELNLRELDQELEVVRDQYPKALVHQLLIFDYAHTTTSVKLPEGLVAIPSPEESKLTTMKTVMCDISAMLLAEMTTLAKSLQGMAVIESPNNGQGTRLNNGYSWPTADDIALRRNSQLTLDSRNESPAGRADRSSSRMSLPAQLRRTPSGILETTPSSRPTTPVNGSQSDVDSRPGSVPPGPQSPERNAVSRVNTEEKFREHSRDRISVQGFGSGSLSERSRTKAKGRIGIAIGSLYLQAGRWGDAVRELVEGAYTALSNSDHLWHAKALENIVIAMLMLAWAGLDFQIPQVCYMSADKAPYHTPSANSVEQSSRTGTRAVSLQNLSALLPELTDKIINKYSRITGESLPQVPLSEIVIRLSKLLTLLHLSGGKLDDQALQVLVQGVPFQNHPNIEMPRLSIQPTRSMIVAILFRAFPSSTATDNFSIVDRTIILAGIASVLDSLGYYRKKALVMREIVSILIPGLIQARKIGAAEMGIHPAAGLAALNAANGGMTGAGAFELGEGDIETGVNDLLGVMCRIYGTVTFKPSTGPRTSSNGDTFGDSDSATTLRIVDSAIMRMFGGQNVKMNVLRACINLAEALPDFQGVVGFSSDLLRTAGSGIAPGPRSEDASPSMTREEQIRLATNIMRTASAAKKLGLQHVEADYWDEFLVRGVDAEPLLPSRTPIPHQKAELLGTAAIAESQERNPFIYNPFLKRPDTAAVEHLLVAEETVKFKVTLQNPYEIDVDIENIRLESEGVDFTSGIQSTVIGPYRTQIMNIYGTPKSAGSLTIKGCLIKIRGCRERRFPIFPESWAPKSDLKIKAVGLAAARRDRAWPTSVESASRIASSDVTAPKPVSVSLHVIEKQPVIIVESSTSSQSAAMVLEGERQTFSITLRNLSTSIPADLLLFSFQDSTQGPLQTALSNRDASAAELYEYELILSRKQALRWIKREGEIPCIQPGGTATFLFEVLGKPGLTGGTVQVDYAYLGVPVSELGQRFYTRQVVFPLTMTVNASVELARMDVLPLAGNIPRHVWPTKYIDSDPDEDIKSEEYCLLMLDLRNAWPSQLKVHLEIAGGHSIEEDILPGSTSRVIFPFRRILLDNPYAPIPALDPSRQRQFVVSTSKISAESERATREAFWYREEILKAICGTWKLASGQERSGVIELRGIRLSARMIEAIRFEEINIELLVESTTTKSTPIPSYQASVNEFVTLKARVSNKASHMIYPILRLQPSLRNFAHNLSLDLSKKLVWDGTLQQTLPALAANDSTEVTLGITALCRGEFEINASVEEARLWENLETKHSETTGSRPRAGTQALIDIVLGTKERRVWYRREPCVLVVNDDESSDDED